MKKLKKVNLKKIIIVSLIIVILLSSLISMDVTPSELIRIENTAPNITIQYPYYNDCLPPALKSVTVTITTDVYADCQYSTSDFMFNQGINFTTGQGDTIHTFEISNLVDNSQYTFYYKSRNVNTGAINSKSVVHSFGVYDNLLKLKILSNSVRIYSSESGKYLRNLLDNIASTNYTTDNAKIWNDENTLVLNFKLPDKTGCSTDNYSISYFRFRCPNLDMSPDKYDIWVDNTRILTDITKTPTVPNDWVYVDVPDTYLTYAGGSFKIIIKSVQGNGKQKISIGDIEIFSSKEVEWVTKPPHIGFLGILPWWNNLQWAHALRVDDVDCATTPVNKYGSLMPLTLAMWREYPTNWGDVITITQHGHEYASHGYTHQYTWDYTYAQGRDLGIKSKNYIENNVANTSRWSDNTVISFAFPGSHSNFYVAEALYDIGFRYSGGLGGGLEDVAKSTGWIGWQGGINTTRDELDWMHTSGSMGNVKKGNSIFSNGFFDMMWNYTRNNGLFGIALCHCSAECGACDVLDNKYIDAVMKDKTGWKCTIGEARSYRYYYDHMNITYNSDASTYNSKIFDVQIHYENHGDKRIWKVPVTFGFNLTELNLNKTKVIKYLENDSKLHNICNLQSMCEGYYFDNNILYLSLMKENGEQIIISQGEDPIIIATLPSANSSNIPLNETIVIRFSEPMDSKNMTYTCLPDPGGWEEKWSDNNTVVTCSHELFNSLTTYTFQITNVKDFAGNDLAVSNISNPWSFTTLDRISPKIIEFYPENGSLNVLPNTDIIIKFSKEMNSTSIQFSCSPDPGGWLTLWLDGDKTVIYSHNNFIEKVCHNFRIIDGEDTSTNKLINNIESNSRSFIIKDISAPKIISTSPKNQSINIQLSENIIITFNEPIATGALEYVCESDPGNWTQNWNDNYTIVTFFHNPFNKSNSYIFSIIKTTDLAGNALESNAELNQIMFTTIYNTPPKIISKPIATAIVSKQYFYDVDAVDNENDNLRYYLDTKPSGMEINATTGLIKWLPKVNHVGNNFVVVIVSDNEDNSYQNFTISVSIVEKEKYIPDESNYESKICWFLPISFIILIIFFYYKEL